jgi:hypothetical protein
MNPRLDVEGAAAGVAIFQASRVGLVEQLWAAEMPVEAQAGSPATWALTITERRDMDAAAIGFDRPLEDTDKPHGTDPDHVLADLARLGEALARQMGPLVDRTDKGSLLSTCRARELRARDDQLPPPGGWHWSGKPLPIVRDGMIEGVSGLPGVQARADRRRPASHADDRPDGRGRSDARHGGQRRLGAGRRRPVRPTDGRPRRDPHPARSLLGQALYAVLHDKAPGWRRPGFCGARGGVRRRPSPAPSVVAVGPHPRLGSAGGRLWRTLLPAATAALRLRTVI